MYIFLPEKLRFSLGKDPLKSTTDREKTLLDIEITQTLTRMLKRNSRQKATEALFGIEYESNLRVKA